jgi:deoxyribonuclease-4
MGKEAIGIGANTFQFFTRNPRGSAAKTFNKADVATYLEFSVENNLQPILAHAPYTLNACAKDDGIRKFTVEIMADDLRRLEYVPECFYNVHPGNHVQQGIPTGIKRTAETLNEILKPHQSTIVLLETMAGKGSEIGRSFVEIRDIIDMVDMKERLGVCLDTCHVFDAGYDIVKNLDAVLDEFDQVIGLGRLKALHLNDSMNPLGSHKDRHAKIGEGYIGMEAFERIINHPALKALPFYLETPNDVQGYAKEIAVLKNAYHKT